MAENKEQQEQEQPTFPEPVQDQNGYTADDDQFYEIDRSTWVRVADLRNGKFMYQKVLQNCPYPVYIEADIKPEILTYRRWREVMEGKPWNQIVQENTPKPVRK